MNKKKTTLLTAFILVFMLVSNVSANSGDTYRLTVSTEDYRGFSTTVDEICIDGTCDSNTRNYERNLQQGSHTVEINDAYYGDVTDQVEVNWNKEKTYTLEPVSSDGGTGYSFTVKTEYNDISQTSDKICVDGKCVTNKREYTFSVSEGYHNVEIQNSAFQDIEDREYISRDRTKTYTLDQVDEGELSVSNVRASNNNIENGEDTVLKADVRNTHSMFRTVMVNWFVREDSDYIKIASSSSKDISSDTTRTFSKTMDYNDLEEEGLNVEENYRLYASIGSTGNKVSGEAIRLEEETVIPSNRCDLDVGSLNIEDDSIEEDGKTSASLRVENDGTEGQDVRVRFYSDGGKTADLNRYLSSGESYNFRDSHIPGSEDEDGDTEIEVKAVVTVTDGSCADEDFRSEKTDSITVWDGGTASNLEARFDVSDRYPDVDQEVTFDAGDSTGDIVDYRWVFGDGEDGSGVEETHSYDDPGNYEAELIVEDSNGNRETARETIVVEDVDQDQCDLNVGSLNLNPDEVEEGDSSTASVVVTNNGRQGQDVFVKFYSNKGTYETYSEFFTVGESERFTAEVAESSDTVVKAKVVANSDDCEEFTYERSNMMYVVEDSYRDNGDGDQAHLTIKVRDEDYDPVYGALVEVENSDYEDDVTSSDGESEFSLDPDSYDITVSKDGYDTEYRSVNLDEGERDTVYVTLEDDSDFRDPDDDEDIERGVNIRDVDYPSRVCEGSSFTASVRVRNEGDFHEVITLTGSGLGSITTGQSTSVEEGESKTINLRFTNVEGSGDEEFKIVLTNHNDDRVYRHIDVDTSCYGGDTGYDPTPPVTDSPDSITLDVSPQKTTIGNSVMAKGFVHGARGRQNVEITIDGQRKARVTTQPDGYYQVYLTPSKVGSQNVRASTGRVSANREIEMIPTASVLAVKAPEKKFVGDDFEVCGDVESPATPKVYLLKDGRVVDFKSGSGEVCFDVEAREEGTHRFEVRALSYGQVSSSFTTTQVLPVGSEVENFPDKVAMVESEEGMVKVRLYNQHDEVKRYNVRLEGLPSTWSSQSEKEILLTTGERSNVYFYLTPREVGRYDPTVIVESDNEKIFETEILMDSGGTKTVRSKSFFDRMADFFRL